MDFPKRFWFCWWIVVVGITAATGCRGKYKVYFYSRPVIVTTSLPEGEVGVAYPATQLTATGAPTPYIWSDVNNTLQTYGLTLNPTTGEITGTPTQATPAGGVTVTISVTDAINGVAQKDFTLVIYPELQITTATLPDAYDGQTGYSATLTATGGKGGTSYLWSIVSGSDSLPRNLNLDLSGLISGDIASDASAGSPYDFTVVVTDGIGEKQANLSITVYAQLQIATNTLPDAYEGVSYNYTLNATGGNPGNYNWSISGQPSWLTINSSTGKLSGTPPSGSAGNTYTFTVEVTDGQQTTSKQFSLVVGSTPIAPKADFEASPTIGSAPLTVTFIDKSTGTITQWEWDFDNDGIVDSTAQNPTHTYNNAGQYTVKLTVTGPAGSDTCVKERYILVPGNVYYVDGVNGDDANGGTGWNDAFATIGKALSVAGDYDLVLVADATYNETNLDFGGKKIYLKGVDHNTAGAQPVIDCQNSGRAFYFGSDETKECVVDNFTIKNGSSVWLDGGAIYCYLSSPTITNCTFINNSTGCDGGAIYCSYSSPTIINCIFSGNSATGSDSCGGAITCDQGSPTIIGCTFINNNSVWNGGAIYFYWSSDSTVINCTFKNNSATGSVGGGGAIYCDRSSPSITNCTFSGNSASVKGGAICCNSLSPSMTNCIFSGNSAGDYGGAIYCEWYSRPTLNNCTFSGNSADYGGAITCDWYSSPALNNCILWGNSAFTGGNEIYIKDSGSSCALNYCCVDNTGYGGQTGNITENNCIHQDPQFVDAANGDYHLQDTSPCIDAGDNSLVPTGVTTDLDGNPRIVDGDNDGTPTVDIGAYEYQQ